MISKIQDRYKHYKMSSLEHNLKKNILSYSSYITQAESLNISKDVIRSVATRE